MNLLLRCRYPLRPRISQKVQSNLRVAARNDFLIGTGDFKDEIAVFISGAADEQASMVEKLDLGLENGPFFLHHLQSDVSPAAADFMRSDLQSAITGQGHHARLARTQVETFAAKQAVGGVVEHGLQFADVPFQFRIDHGAIARCQDGVHTDPTTLFGQQGFGGPVPGEHQYRKHQ